MAKKNEKKVSISALDSVIGERFLNTVEETWYDIEVKMCRNIPFTETLAFADDVAKSCFQQNGAYVPEVLDFAIKSNIISRYTNISLPDNLDHRYEILYNTDLVSFVCGHINMDQVQEITTAIKRKLSYMCETNTVAIQSRLNDLVKSFDDMEKKAADMFKGLTPDDMTRLVNAIGDTGFSEEKVVEAYLKQAKTQKAETATTEVSE